MLWHLCRVKASRETRKKQFNKNMLCKTVQTTSKGSKTLTWLNFSNFREDQKYSIVPIKIQQLI